MGLTKVVAKNLDRIDLNKTNGSFKIFDKDYIMFKNGTTVFKDSIGREINERFETLFMANDLSHAILTSIGGNRYSIVLEEQYAPTVGEK